ncbi:Bug family tripartite tricarboxylate transporter substrate binding protein [Falsiroseomonas stagni]|uniref:Tripartite-type tricarboxylate transporter, receptor component TctC n=1 Tax=Falsiroseomonas stagni DSM 19981 TaxID=1123062 RepID=A0A1I4CNB3_9PROT|nr:tripartite tricarboxylate transporter substrate binding protein [Falsiroseomonas stagni]SFK82764.1 Tripartite-type tricarboxylate transporter, receptor component TctC [Falsiroseomonas stagni DSM 19981]
MMTITRRALVASALFAPAVARAQITRPVRLIVPFAAGGGSDTLARLLSVPLTERLGQPVVVENRAGAGSQIGAEAVMRSAPDGTTLLLGDTPLATIPAVQVAGGRPAPFDAARDFSPVAALAIAPALVVVGGQSRFRTLGELLAAARANPAAIDFASAGVASSTHLILELLQMRAGVRVTHVPYRGAAPAVQDVLAGTVQATIMALATAAPLVQSGQIRVIGVASEQRIAAMPDVPTLKEQGVDLVSGFWWGVLGPLGIPDPVLAQLVTAIEASMASEAMTARLPALGLNRLALGPAEFRALLASETRRWGEVVQAAGIKPE